MTKSPWMHEIFRINISLYVIIGNKMQIITTKEQTPFGDGVFSLAICFIQTFAKTMYFTLPSQHVHFLLQNYSGAFSETKPCINLNPFIKMMNEEEHIFNTSLTNSFLEKYWQVCFPRK